VTRAGVLLAAVVALCVLGSVLLIGQVGDPFCTDPVNCSENYVRSGAAELPVYRSGTWQRFSGGGLDAEELAASQGALLGPNGQPDPELQWLPGTLPPGVPSPVELIRVSPQGKVWYFGKAGPGLMAWGWDGQRVTSSVLIPGGAQITDAVALGPADVWAAGRGFLSHWDGRSWRRVGLSLRGVQYTAVASDGRGGVWIGCDQPYLLHYGAGRWSEAPLPIGADWAVRVMSNVHGSTEMWALAEAPTPGTRKLLLHYTS
jgi:hypothetical protein